MQYFCLDIGGTETRGALFATDGSILARAKGPGGALSLGAAQTEKAIRHVWHEVGQTLASDIAAPATTRLYAGIAGKGLPGRAKELGERLSDFAQTHFTGDGYGALLDATNGKPGALISIGTGVTALRLDEAGNTLALSGWGFPAGDLGSGAGLGLRLTGALTKHLDGITLTPPFPATLAQSIMGIVGHSPDQIMAWQTTSKPREYGKLAPLIVDCAASGDPFCRQMLQSAASEITDLAHALYTDGHGDIHLAGGLKEVMLPYCVEQAPAFNWHAGSVDPVMGIYLLASGQAPDEKLLPRPGLSALQTKEQL